MKVKGVAIRSLLVTQLTCCRLDSREIGDWRKPKKKSFLEEYDSENDDKSSNVDNFGSIYDGAAELVGQAGDVIYRLVIQIDVQVLNLKEIAPRNC